MSQKLTNDDIFIQQIHDNMKEYLKLESEEDIKPVYLCHSCCENEVSNKHFICSDCERELLNDEQYQKELRQNESMQSQDYYNNQL